MVLFARLTRRVRKRGSFGWFCLLWNRRTTAIDFHVMIRLHLVILLFIIKCEGQKVASLIRIAWQATTFSTTHCIDKLLPSLLSWLIYLTIIRRSKISILLLFSLTVKPIVAPVPANGLLVVQTGDTVTLSCKVTAGSPPPDVQWHRRERKMPSGEERIHGQSITFTSVNRHHSGNYICSADNGFGEPSETILKLDVQRKCQNDKFLNDDVWLKTLKS